jgi:hypothetical protein
VGVRVGLTILLAASALLSRDSGGLARRRVSRAGGSRADVERPDDHRSPSTSPAPKTATPSPCSSPAAGLEDIFGNAPGRASASAQADNPAGIPDLDVTDVILGQTVEALRVHKAAQNAERLRLGGMWQDSTLIFCTHGGKPLDFRNLAASSFKPLLKRASLPDIRFHDLRHTCATLLLSRGQHPKLVQELLGHASVAMTLDRYSHVLPIMGDQTAAAMEAALS